MENKEMFAVFCGFIESTLVEKDYEKAISFLSEDVIGIGMGEQGFICGREDVKKLIAQNKGEGEKSTTSVEFGRREFRHYTPDMGTVCVVIQIKTVTDGKTVQSALGQLMNLRKIEGKWQIYTIQATPLFEQIEELEAYPLKFAENVLEKYRRQEQIAKHVNSNCDAIYFINFTKGIFEDALIKKDYVVQVESGDKYEETIFQSARVFLEEEYRYDFMTLFSIGNILRAYQQGDTELTMDYRMRYHENTHRWVRSTLKLYRDNNSDQLRGCLYVIDIDTEKMKNLDLQNRAELDSMTGLYNKSSAEYHMEEALQKREEKETYAFFMIDLDHFKGINDRYGHQEGDRIIRETARSIQSMLRKEDIAGRLGGDEFGILFCGEITTESIEGKAAYLCDQVRRLIPIKKQGTSCSIGIAIQKGKGNCFPQMYAEADKALYQQKEKGRNGYTFA